MDGQATHASAESASKAARRKALVAASEETRLILPYLLSKRPFVQGSARLYDCAKDSLRLGQKYNPGLKAEVSVVNADTLDLALTLPASTPSDPSQPLVLNLASAYQPGGGWLHGALAQEEALFYRTSLFTSLSKRFYPLSTTQALYSPNVLAIRRSLAEGHGLYDLNRPEEMRTISVVSVAAIKEPELVNLATGEKRYKDESVRSVTQDKIRSILRIAGRTKHRRVVLGALGCGAYRHPNLEVVDIFAKTLGEVEFRGWFEKVLFAVFDEDTSSTSNFNVFKKRLEGLKL